MDSLVGQTLSERYHIQALIGRGGMADVYKAWDSVRLSFLALKLLHEDLALERDFLQRFHQEAQTLAYLQHPNIVRFFGLEQDGKNTFMLMEHVDGETLRVELFKNQGVGLTTNRVMQIMHPICRALYYAHQLGMVHCDVKPANIMISRQGEVMLTDFGIVRMVGSTTDMAPIMGTSEYMALEQSSGQSPTPQTDIYALGVTLFEMFTGGDLPMARGQNQFKWRKSETSSTRLSHPKISSALEGVINRCLETNPGRRYPDTLALLNELTMAVRTPSQGGEKGKGWIATAKQLKEIYSLRRIWPILTGVLILLTAFFVTMITSKNYEVLECVTVSFSQDQLQECVTGVTILIGGFARFDVSWTASLTDSRRRFSAQPGRNNIETYLTDDLGNQYDPILAGEGAREGFILYDEESAYGWYLFPPTASEARYFVLHDDDNGVQIQPIMKIWP